MRRQGRLEYELFCNVLADTLWFSKTEIKRTSNEFGDRDQAKIRLNQDHQQARPVAMATINKRPNGTFEIRFFDHHGNRKSICLPPAEKNRSVAESTASKIEHIASRLIQGAEPDRAVAEWIATLPGKLHNKLVRVGLVAPRQEQTQEPEENQPTAPTLKDWTDKYIEEHSAKDGTIEQLEITARSLCKMFGDDKPIDSFTAGDAEVFRKWLETKGNERKKYKTGLARNTVRRRIGRSKQFFNAAIKHELITKNPFDGEASAVGGNAERMFLVPSDWIESCIRKAPCEDWRIILAFARYAGMRSHECRIQKWEDIDIPNRRMTVRSNKTPPVRVCPIFPELMPHLMRAREMAPAGAIYVQTRYDHEANILTTLEAIVKKAGLIPWPKLMQNLRATRETELLANYPAKDVTGWLGNSPDVANKHYAIPMQASFDRAVRDGAGTAGVTAEAAEKSPNLRQTELACGCPGLSPVHENTGDIVLSLFSLLNSYPART